MNEPKHTPGPWDVYDRRRLFSGNEGSATIIAGDIWIACVHGSHVGPQSKEEADANISLIAAAPELLEALYIVDACGEPNRVVLYDGETEGWEWVHPDGREWHEVGCWEDTPPMHPVARAAIAKAEGLTHETP